MVVLDPGQKSPCFEKWEGVAVVHSPSCLDGLWEIGTPWRRTHILAEHPCCYPAG